MNYHTTHKIESAIPFLIGLRGTLPLPIRHRIQPELVKPYQWALKIQDCCGEIEPATAVVATPFSYR